ncbi:MAG: hypothetical protein HIU89_10245 [Proteobacteria bacterium]|nr:hypothetical protein [Pseudomonadota bacterium]
MDAPLRRTETVLECTPLQVYIQKPIRSSSTAPVSRRESPEGQISLPGQLGTQVII